MAPIAPRRRGACMMRAERAADVAAGYLRRSRIETKMHCVTLLGQRLATRDFDRQVAELQVRVAVLNGFIALGIPETQAVG